MNQHKQLQERFGLSDGRFFAYYRYKNLNWHLAKVEDPKGPMDVEWICYGDVTNEDIHRIMPLLEPGEALYLGWKDMPASEVDWEMPLFGYNRVWLVFTTSKV